MRFERLTISILALTLTLGTPALAQMIGGDTGTMQPVTTGTVKRLNIDARTLMVNNIVLKVPKGILTFSDVMEGDDVTVRFQKVDDAYVVQELTVGLQAD